MSCADPLQCSTAAALLAKSTTLCLTTTTTTNQELGKKVTEFHKTAADLKHIVAKAAQEELSNDIARNQVRDLIELRLASVAL